MAQSNSKALVDAVNEAGPSGISVDELVLRFGGTAARKDLRRALKALSREGVIARVDKNVFAGTQYVETTKGVLSYLRGSYRVYRDSGGPIEIPVSGLGTAVAGDTVQVSVFDDGVGRPTGSVIAVVQEVPRNVRATLKRAGRNYIGTADGIGEAFVIAGDRVTETRELNVVVGGRRWGARGVRGVSARPLLARPAPVGRQHKPTASAEPAHSAAPSEPTPSDDAWWNVPRMLDAIAAEMEVDGAFSAAALDVAKAAQAPEVVAEGERDLRGLPLVTIDPATAKDFDDAVHAESLDNGHIRLTVAIADVSRYVVEGSELDHEALARSFSVYLPGRVYPMLPHILSDDVCSLRPGRDRACAWVEMEIDKRGGTVAYDVGFGVMRSAARFAYEQVQAFVDGEPLAAAGAIRQSLRALNEVFERLNSRRRRRGMLDLDLPEPKLILSEDGLQVADIQPYPRQRAHRIVEECMLATNETVAAYLQSVGAPGVYRVHGEPEPEGLRELSRFLKTLDEPVRISAVPSVHEITELLGGMGAGPRANILSMRVLRTLQRAEYSAECLGHYGIGAQAYAHFTSPIRRYPDLAVHRQMRRAIAGDFAKGKGRWGGDARMRTVATAANTAEKRATDAERAAGRALRALYMRERVGEHFDAVISGVQAFGIFVSVQDPYVEGMCPIRTLGSEYFVYDETSASLTGSRTGKRYRLGDAVRVECTKVELAERRTTFAPVLSELSERSGEASRKASRKGAKPYSKRRRR